VLHFWREADGQFKYVSEEKLKEGTPLPDVCFAIHEPVNGLEDKSLPDLRHLEYAE